MTTTIKTILDRDLGLRACRTTKGTLCMHKSGNVKLPMPENKYAYVCTLHYNASISGKAINLDQTLIRTDIQWEALRRSKARNNTAGADQAKQLTLHPVPPREEINEGYQAIVDHINTNKETPMTTTGKVYNLACNTCDATFKTQDRSKLEALKERGGKCKRCFDANPTAVQPKATHKPTPTPTVNTDRQVTITCQEWLGKGKCGVKVLGTIAEHLAHNNRCPDHTS